MSIGSAKLELSRYESFIMDVRRSVALRQEDDDFAYTLIDSLAKQIKEFYDDEERLKELSDFFCYHPNFDVIFDELEKLKRQPLPDYEGCSEVLSIFEKNLRMAEETSRKLVISRH